MKKDEKWHLCLFFAFLDATAKSHDHSFEVLQKSQIGNFSVVTLRVSTLKIPDLVFFAIHPKFLIGTFVCYPLYLASFPLREWVVKNSSEQREKLAKTENFAMVE